MSPAEISAIVAAVGLLISAVTAFIKFGMGERGSLTITQAQGAATILDGALKALRSELDRKDEEMDELRAELQQARLELAAVRAGRQPPEAK